MNAKTFNWHNWHEPQARDGDEVGCNACKQWSLLSDWQECYVKCDSCGEHAAAQCPKCKVVIDLAMESLMSRPPQTKKGEGVGKWKE